MASSCQSCRVQKVRCGGERPACEHCITSNMNCEYDVERTALQPLLSRGSACLPCRSKKKKCDGARPHCQPCVAARKEHRCVYENTVLPILVERNRELEEQLKILQAKLDAQPSNDLYRANNSFQLQGRDPNLVQPRTATISQSSAIIPTYYTSHSHIPASTEYPWFNNSTTTPNLNTYDPISLASYTNFNAKMGSIPGSFIPNEPVMHRELVTPQETDLARARAYALSRGIVYNIRFTQPKTEALIYGDLSGTYIRPSVVHATHVWGLALLARAEGTSINHALLIQHAVMAQAALTIPPVSREEAMDDVATLCLLTTFAYNAGDIVQGATWMSNAITTARGAGLRISLPLVTNGMHASPESAHTRTATSEEQERDALTFLIVADLAVQKLILHPSQLWEELDEDWKALMTYCEERCGFASVQTTRLTALCIFFETYHLQPKQHDAVLDVPIPLGIHPVNPIFIRRARRFLAHLEGPILTFSAIGNRPVLVILQECALLVHTALLNVYLALALYGYDEGRRKGVAALLEIVSITKTLRPEELDCLDPFIVLCWSAAIRTLNRERRGSGPLGGLGVHDENIDKFINVLGLVRFLFLEGCVQFSKSTWAEIMRAIGPIE